MPTYIIFRLSELPQPPPANVNVSVPLQVGPSQTILTSINHIFTAISRLYIDCIFKRLNTLLHCSGSNWTLHNESQKRVKHPNSGRPWIVATIGIAYGVRLSTNTVQLLRLIWLSQASTLNQNDTGPVGPVTPSIYWFCKMFTGPTFFL